MGNLLDTSLFQELAEQEENEGQVVDGVTLSPGVEFIPEFHNTELDLDRDIPTPPVASPAVNSMFMSKPITDFIALDDDIEMVSDCCGAEVYEDYGICSDCNDHCGSEPMDDVAFDKYCEDNPEFNAALNGHPEWI